METVKTTTPEVAIIKETHPPVAEGQDFNNESKVYGQIGETRGDIEFLANGLRIENLRGNELSPEEVSEISDFYLEIFRNKPYSQFLLNENDPLTPISPQEAFGKLEQKYFSLEELENYELKEGEHYWMEKEKTREINKLRINEDSYVTIMRDEEGKLVGAVFGRSATLKEIFETEEMKNPLLLSDYHDEDLLADENRFYSKMKKYCSINLSDKVFFVSGLAIHIKNRGFDNFFNLMKNFWKSLSKEDLSFPLFSEIEKEGAAHDIDVSISGNEIFGILENGHPIIYCDQADNFAKFFFGEKKSLFGRIKEYKKGIRKIDKIYTE